jgi:ABC-2 type transport system permease protein
MSAARLGVVDADGSPISATLVAAVTTSDIDLDVRTYPDVAELRDAVERGYVEIGVVIPAGHEAAILAGSTASVEVVTQPISAASIVRTAVDRAIARESAVVAAARIAVGATHVDLATALAAARARQPGIGGMDVRMESVSDLGSNPAGFALGAQSQVILFMFLTSTTGAAVLVTSRQLGVSRRELSTPTPIAAIIAGEALGRFAFAVFQGGFIVVATAVLFGVDWIDPLATGAIVGAFALVAAGAAMLVGSLVRNEHQVSAVGPALGMIFGLLGGTMVPIEVFPEVMRDLSHVTPHAWAMEGLHHLLLQGGGLADVLPQVAVLLGFAAVLLAVATIRFRRVLSA